MKVLTITPDMLDARGAITGVNFGRSDLRQIDIRSDVKTLIIDHALIAPLAWLRIEGPTRIEIRGDARFHHVTAEHVFDQASPFGSFAVHGTLSSAHSILLHGTLHATGSIHVAKTLVATESIHCNGRISAAQIWICGDIFVDDGIADHKVLACRNLTIYGDAPMPAIADPEVIRAKVQKMGTAFGAKG